MYVIGYVIGVAAGVSIILGGVGLIAHVSPNTYTAASTAFGFGVLFRPTIAFIVARLKP